MSRTITAAAPCKLNLHLRVRERRNDGYHSIESLFQQISLADSLTVSIDGSSGSCSVLCPGFDLPAVNTVTKAVEQFRLETRITDGISVRLDKKVPAGAGLGGGSSDAACMLQCLDELFETQLEITVLSRMAARIGSDVPFFLHGGAALVEGRGETVTPFASRTDLFGVLVWPDIHSSTAEAYRLVDEWMEQGGERGIDWPDVRDLQSMYNASVDSWRFRNSFEQPIGRRHPEITALICDFRQAGAAYAAMTGSGSTVFALFEDPEKASRAHALLSVNRAWCSEFLLLASSSMQ